MLEQEKRALRAEMLACRSTKDDAELLAAAQQITENLLPYIEQNGFHRVFCYISYGKEIPTHSLLHALYQNGIEVFVPYVCGQQMQAVCWRPDMEMRQNRWGIWEPAKRRVAQSVECALLPGVAFGLDGSRLGYGGGYYDRWLAEHPCCKIGLCGSWQMVKSVPMAEHDIRPDAIFTEKQQIFFTI